MRHSKIFMGKNIQGISTKPRSGKCRSSEKKEVSILSYYSYICGACTHHMYNCVNVSYFYLYFWSKIETTTKAPPKRKDDDCMAPPPPYKPKLMERQNPLGAPSYMAVRQRRPKPPSLPWMSIKIRCQNDPINIILSHAGIQGTAQAWHSTWAWEGSQRVI